MNELLAATALNLRLADDGDDIGRMVRVTAPGIEPLVSKALSAGGEMRDEVAHSVELFRSRTGSRQERRSAIVVLAGILERRRTTLKAELLSKDERALFQIANGFDLRHRKADQQAAYDDAYLDWIFYWYLATVQLTDELLDRQGQD